MREVLVLRHAIAEDRDEAARLGVTDERRALTERGIRRMREVAAGLARVADPPARILHSPLRRAVETAELLAVVFPKARLVETPALAPGAGEAAVYEMLAQGEDGVAIVGHEPDLGEWLGSALGGRTGPAIPLKKAGSALVRFPGVPTPGRGELRWLLPPRLARQLGET
ncbi:histidine phosphatase family protein [Arhodomonas aquaeolei]|uniref:SixA phosphatase family protein n=1 Tax=Arhodomonas aquaeolei TaxID=2369 RepID=UPI002166CF52|nr:histidine phosphatase family protein [Arhodomonas aquaeolei]MCS4503719.1 histidine phosphatase family protein [Arhodomonas aquaeolei]